MDTFEQFHFAPCVQPDILHTYPSGAMDMILTLDSIAWTGLDFHAPMIFQHSGIAYTRFIAEPVEHFVIHGFLDAVQHCIMRAMLYSLMEKPDFQSNDFVRGHFITTMSPLPTNASAPCRRYYPDCARTSAPTGPACSGIILHGLRPSPPFYFDGRCPHGSPAIRC
jgi:hypothetical protein